jgi:hypothetical protein
VPWMVPPFPADCAHSPDALNEKQIAITAKMTRRIDVCISYPPKVLTWFLTLFWIF